MFKRLVNEGIALMGTAASPNTLTAAYNSTDRGQMSVADGEDVTLYIAYTMGSTETSNSLEMVIEFSADGSTWYRKTNEAESTGTTTLTKQEYTFAAVSAAATYDYIRVKVTDIADKYMRVLVKETGKASNFGTCFIIANLGKE